MPPLSPPSNLSSMVLLIPFTALASPLYDSSDSRQTALNMRGYTPTPLPLQTFLSPPVICFLENLCSKEIRKHPKDYWIL